MSERFDDDRADAYDDGPGDAPERNQIVRRSFEGVSALMQNAATQALTAKATADINARWMIAMHRPRVMMDVRADLLKECERPGFAASAIYRVPRGGATITGMSVRFAEAAMKAMGNMGAEAQTLYDSDDERVVRVTVTDFERNTAWSRDLTISKTREVKALKRGQQAISTRVNSYGDTVFRVEATPDDVTTKEAAEISKASRTGVLRLVPGWLLAECRERCDKTAQNKAAQDPDVERRKIADAFSGLNVKPSWLTEYLGHDLDATTPAEIVELQQLYRAIRDGHTTPDQAIAAKRGDADKPARPPSVAAAAVGGRRGRRQEQPPSSEPTDAELAKHDAEINAREGQR